MNLRPETEQFLSDLEVHAGRRLEYRAEVGMLLDLARSSGTVQLFDDVIFYAKFLVKSSEIMKRIGTGGEGYDKLAAEFRDTMEKAVTLIRTLVKESDESTKQRFVGLFFGLDHEALGRLMRFLADLSRVKNWVVDGKSLP
ncbi:MAG: hypothetical protein WD295_03085 [Bacteroidota bacterium]